ncbi:hypothetical protein VP01_12499g1, partial [Puccinia sorghi]
VEPLSGLNHICTSSKTNPPLVLSTIGIDSNNNCSPCLGTQMKSMARRQLISPSYGLSSRESIGMMPTSLSIFKKGFRQLIYRTIKLENCYHDKVWSSRKTDSTPSTLKNEDASKYKSSKKFRLKPSTPLASSLASRQKRSTKIASVLNKEGQLNGVEHARREKEGLC